MATPHPQTLDQIKVLLRRDLKLGPDIEIPDDMPFAGTDADFDSLDILLLLTSIEKQFHIKIPSEVVGKEVFKNVSTLASYVEKESRPAAAIPPDYLAELPHRDPFRFITAIKSVQRGDHAEATWSLSGKEAFFAGHFPNQPLVPGVLIAEALAQLSGVVGPTDSKQGKLVHVDVRFDRSVEPPAEITLRSRCLRSVGGLEQFEVSALVGEEVVARGMLTLSKPREGSPGGAL